MAQGLASASVLQSLTKEHLIKNGAFFLLFVSVQTLTSFPDVSINVLTLVFRAYLVDQSMDHLSAALKRGGIRDLISFFPGNKQEGKFLEEHFKNANLPQVAEWYAKKQHALAKDAIVKEVQSLVEREESPEQVCCCVLC